MRCARKAEDDLGPNPKRIKAEPSQKIISIAKTCHTQVTDDKGHFIVMKGSMLGENHKIICQLGEGTFSKVVECEDLRTGERVAIKVVRAVKKYQETALLEMQTLKTLQASDALDAFCFAKPLSHFSTHDHFCIIFQKFGLSLYDFLKKNKFKGFGLSLVRDIAHQTLCCVKFCHDLQLIHTDLKPENILLESDASSVDAKGCNVPISSKIRIIDFGSSTFEHQHHATLIQTRHYRSPEVILGLGWSFPADIWSVGCILVELLTGDALFQTHDSQEHLCMMGKVFGHFPAWLGSKCMVKDANLWFDKEGNLRPLAPCSEGARFLAKMRTIHQLLGHLPDLEDLTSRMLKYDPAQRITANEALQHRFFRDS